MKFFKVARNSPFNRFQAVLPSFVIDSFGLRPGLCRDRNRESILVNFLRGELLRLELLFFANRFRIRG